MANWSWYGQYLLPVFIIFIPLAIYLSLLVWGFRRFTPFTPPFPVRFNRDVYLFIAYSLAFLTVVFFINIIAVYYEKRDLKYASKTHSFYDGFATFLSFFVFIWFGWLVYISQTYFISQSCLRCCNCCQECNATATSRDAIKGRKQCIKCAIVAPIIFGLFVLCLTFATWPWLALFILGSPFLLWFFISMMFSNNRWPTLIMSIPSLLCYGGSATLLVLVAPFVSIFSTMGCMFTQISAIFACSGVKYKKGVTGTEVGISFFSIIRRSINFVNIFISVFLIHDDDAPGMFVFIGACQFFSITWSEIFNYYKVFKPILIKKDLQREKNIKIQEETAWDMMLNFGCGQQLYSIKKWYGDQDFFYGYQFSILMSHQLCDSVLTVLDICLLIAVNEQLYHHSYVWDLLRIFPIISILMHYLQLRFITYELMNKGYIDIYGVDAKLLSPPPKHSDRPIELVANVAPKVTNGVVMNTNQGTLQQNVQNSAPPQPNQVPQGIPQGIPQAIPQGIVDSRVDIYSDYPSCFKYCFGIFIALDIGMRSFPFICFITGCVAENGLASIFVSFFVLGCFTWEYKCAQDLFQLLAQTYPNRDEFKNVSFFKKAVVAIAWYHSSFFVILMGLNRKFMVYYNYNAKTYDIFDKELKWRNLMNIICILALIPEPVIFFEAFGALIAFTIFFSIFYFSIREQLKTFMTGIRPPQIQANIQYIQPMQTQPIPVQPVQQGQPIQVNVQSLPVQPVEQVQPVVQPENTSIQVE